MLDFLEMNERKASEFSVESIQFNGRGGTDICGEWQWNGDYEMSMSSSLYPVDYNYYASIQRRRSRKGGITIGWHVKMYLNMFHGNSYDIQVLDVKVKTLKSAREAIFNKMMELKGDKAGTKEMIEAWKAKRAKPVFAIEKDTGKILLIGTAYTSVTIEFQRVDQLWFNEDVPNYKEHKHLYELSRYWRSEKNFSATSVEVVCGGYCGTFEQNNELLNQMINLAKQEEKYGHLFHDKKILNCVDNTDYEASLTIGKEYRVEIEHVNLHDSIQRVLDDNGDVFETSMERFK